MQQLYLEGISKTFSTTKASNLHMAIVFISQKLKGWNLKFFNP